ncbi:hypothetical protein AB0L13_11345 [Saccharopolyspora shandongensis]|uniref:hypothetical protein n=1 Tax=Saccharopolyspora shandongensis TaxID=418495 RepID=UPI00342DDA60
MSATVSLPVILRAGEIDSTIGTVTLPAGSSPDTVRHEIAELLRAAADYIDGMEDTP